MATMRFTLMREDLSIVFAREYGVTQDSATIITALQDIGGDVCVLVLSDDLDGVWTLATDITIPPNVTLQIPAGVTVAGIGSMIIQGGLMALRTGWFQSTGTLTWLGGEGQYQLNRLRAGPTQLSILTLDSPLAVEQGGTAARTPEQARINLGIVPGTDVEEYDPLLMAIASLVTSANTMMYFTGSDQVALTGLSPYSRTLLDDLDAGAWRTTMGLGALAPLSSITTPYVTDKAITYAKMQDVAPARLMGNTTAAYAAPQEISVGAGLALSGGQLSLTGGTITGTGQADRVAIWSSGGALTFDNVLRFLNSTKMFVVDSPTLAVDSVAHRVGIGTLTPGAALDVIGTPAESSILAKEGIAVLSPSNTAGKIAFYANMSGTYQAGCYAFYAQGSVPSYFGGSVAIGMAPVIAGSRLDVNGMISTRSCLQIWEPSNATSSLFLYLRTITTYPAGTYAIYQQGNVPNFFEGQVGIKTFPDSGFDLKVNGGIHVLSTSIMGKTGFSVVPAASYNLDIGGHTRAQGNLEVVGYQTNTSGISCLGIICRNPPGGLATGLRSQISYATDRWDLYCEGGGQGWIYGPTMIGGGAATGRRLQIYGDVDARGSFTASAGYYCDNSVAGTITGYRGQVQGAPGSGRWNCYMEGSADNYFGGRVGVFNSSPGTELDVNGNVRALKGFSAYNNSGDNLVALHLPVMTAGGSNRWNIYGPGDAQNSLSGPVTIGGSLNTNGPVTFGGHLTLYNGGGCLSIGGAVADGTPLKVAFFGGGGGSMFYPKSASTANYMHIFGNSGQGWVGRIETDESRTLYITTSDVRLKTDIEPLSLVHALQIVQAMRPVTYRWRETGNPGTGFLAHELQAIAPEAVAGSPTDNIKCPQGIDHSRLVVWLVGAMQELAGQVEALKAQLAALN